MSAKVAGVKRAPKKVAIHAVGKRKTAIARVFMKEGTGLFVVNQKPMTEYFPFIIQTNQVMVPLKVAELETRFDIQVNVQGGGHNAQSLATQHGVSRALVLYNPELRKTLKPLQLLSRDARKKERKKYGQKGARKRFQYSKR